MIEIKFRAWNGQELLMVHELRFDPDYKKPFGPINIELLSSADKDYYSEGVDYDKCILMQYTCLKDKSGEGEELYHKDLIVNSSRNGGKPHIVEWSEWYAGWVGVYGGLEYLISTELHEIKKVGNIYENPELHEY